MDTQTIHARFKLLNILIYLIVKTSGDSVWVIITVEVHNVCVRLVEVCNIVSDSFQIFLISAGK